MARTTSPAEATEIPGLQALNRLFAGALLDAKRNSAGEAYAQIKKGNPGENEKVASQQKKTLVLQGFQKWKSGVVTAIQTYFPRYIELGFRYKHLVQSDLVEWAEEQTWSMLWGQCRVKRIGTLGAVGHASDSVKWWLAVASQGDPGVNLPERSSWRAPRWLASNGRRQTELLESMTQELSLRFYGALDDEKERARLELAIKPNHVLHLVSPAEEVARKAQADRASAAMACIEESAEFFYSSNYREIRYKGITYRATEKAAAVIRVLDEARRNGNPVLSTNDIRTTAGFPHGGKMFDWINRGGCKGLWNTLIIREGREHYRLDLPRQERVSDSLKSRS